MNTGLFNILPRDYSFKNLVYNIYWYKQNLAVNNPDGLI